jgi:hypothetical protein
MEFINGIPERTFTVKEKRGKLTTTIDFGATKKYYSVIPIEDQIGRSEYIRYNGQDYYLMKVEDLNK